MYKKILILFLYSFILFKIYPNESWLEISGGNYSIVEEQNPNIRLIDEKMIINLYSGHYTVNISYTFFNEGNTVTLDVGFPEFSAHFPWKELDEIKDFRVHINGNFVKTEYIKSAPHVWNSNYTDVEAWYINKITFIENEELNCVVEYRGQHSPLGGRARFMEYLYGTAICWKNGIENFTIEVHNQSYDWIYKFETKFKDFTLRNENDVIIINATEIMPQIQDTFRIYYNYDESDWYSYDDTDRKLTADQLKLLSKSQLRIIRNLFYAKHGYIFNSKDLDEYFKKRWWYRPYHLFNENIFNEIEKINIQLILEEERRRN